MASTTLYRKTGAEAGTIELPDGLFAAPVNTAVMHQVVVAQLAGRHLGTHATKTRGDVAGGGRKPFRQKGTGRARQGSSRSPQMEGGGVVFGPHPRSYDQKVPRRMKRLALRGALTAKFGDGALRVVEDLAMDEIKTRELLGYLVNLRADGRVLVIAAERDDRLERSARNLPAVEVILADSLNTVDVLNADTLLITVPALATMTEVYA
ncbi:MAG: 50S ribosomal protein L4 [Candidatus Limnocylindrales bacterium]